MRARAPNHDAVRVSAASAKAIFIAALLVTLMVVGIAVAKQEVSGGGRTLDANLELGSGGYNRPRGGGSLSNGRYYPVGGVYSTQSGTSRQYNYNHTPRRGSMFDSPSALTKQRYSATGYGGTSSSKFYRSRTTHRYPGRYK